MLGRDGRGAKEKNTVSRARKPWASPLSERGVLGRRVQCGHRRWTKEKRFEKGRWWLLFGQACLVCWYSRLVQLWWCGGGEVRWQWCGGRRGAIGAGSGLVNLLSCEANFRRDTQSSKSPKRKMASRFPKSHARAHTQTRGARRSGRTKSGIPRCAHHATVILTPSGTGRLRSLSHHFLAPYSSLGACINHFFGFKMQASTTTPLATPQPAQGAPPQDATETVATGMTGPDIHCWSLLPLNPSSPDHAPANAAFRFCPGVDGDVKTKADTGCAADSGPPVEDTAADGKGNRPPLCPVVSRPVATV